MRRFLICAAMLFAVFAAAAIKPAQSSAALAPSQRDADSVRAVMENYRTAWLANNPDKVRSVFSADAVIMPHHGVTPAAGTKAIDDFWFPPGTAKTMILKYVRPIDEVDGDSALAYVRGRSEIAWRVEDKGTIEEWQTSGTYLTILKKQADGKWLISRMMWDDLPNQRTK
jgi:uncharacterized protein (TIGR02246 family)